MRQKLAVGRTATKLFYRAGRKRRPSRGRDGTRAALYLRVSTAGQKPDLQHDGLSAYATRAGLEIVELTATSRCQAAGRAGPSSTP